MATRDGGRPLLDSVGTGSEAAAIDHFSFAERAVMAPDISKVDTDRGSRP